MAERAGLSAAVREVGGEIDVEQAPDPLPLSYVQRLCERYEKLLRRQYPPDGALAPDAERELSTLNPSTMTGALRRWAYLKHLFTVRSEGLTKRTESRAEIEEVARQLLRREPVWVRLGDRRVAVTARSYAAMYEIASHAASIRAVEADLELAAEKMAAAQVKLQRAGSWTERARLRSLMRRIADFHAAAYRELQQHRQALYAHAFTESGAPATSPEEAPEWWLEVDPAADQILLTAMVKAGHGRLKRLGPPPPPRGKKTGAEPEEDFGWASLFSTIERGQRVRPAEFYNRDYFQLRMWLRASAPPPLDADD